jgi:hypothetical protein
VKRPRGDHGSQLDEQKECDDAWIDSGRVFTRENGEALDPETVSRFFRQAVNWSWECQTKWWPRLESNQRHQV